MSAPRIRRTEISLCNILLCLFVVWIHVSSAPISTLDPSSAAYALVYFPWRLAAFAVQGFLFLSGLKLFMRPAEDFSYRRFWRSRLLRIVLPYLLWVLIYYIYFVARGYFPFRVVDLLRYAVVGDLSAHFYFVVTILQFYLLMPLWRWMVKRADPTVAVVFALLISLFIGQNLPNIVALFTPEYYFPYTDRVFPTYLIWWVAGCFSGAHYDAFCDMLRRRRTALVVLYAICAAVEGIMGWLHASGRAWIGWLELWHTGYCAAAILCVLSLALAMAERSFTRSPFLSRLDAASWGIFLVHPLIIQITNSLLSRLGIVRIGAAYFYRIALVYAGSLLLCMGWNMVWERLKRYIPFLWNKKNEKGSKTS